MLLDKDQAYKLIKLLNKSIQNPVTSLKYRNKFTLLVSVMLSAQSTDTNVNNVTKNIYKKYYRPEHFVKLGKSKIKKLIKKIGLFNNKANNLYNLSKILLNNYKKKIPNKYEELLNRSPGAYLRLEVLDLNFLRLTLAGSHSHASAITPRNVSEDSLTLACRQLILTDAGRLEEALSVATERLTKQ